LITDTRYLTPDMKLPRYLTQRPRKSGGPAYLWQPHSGLLRQGWRAVRLKTEAGASSPLGVAVNQATWLNAMLEAWSARDHDFIRALAAEWSSGGDGVRFAPRAPGLAAAPFIAYAVPGLKGPRPRAQQPRSMAALATLYRAGDFYGALKPATQKDYDYHLRALDPLIGDRAVASLTRGPLRRLYQTLVKAHGLHVANMRMRVLSAVLTYAIEVEWLGAHPMSRFRLGKTQGRIRYITRPEQAALIEAALAMDRLSIATAIMIACLTGQRRGDICGLNEATYDHGAGALVLRQGKTGQSVYLPVMRELSAFLLDARAQFIARHGDLRARLAAAKLTRRYQWLKAFPAPALIALEETGLPLHPVTLTHLFAEVRAEAAKAQPSCTEVRFQDFRDTAITEMLRAKIPLPQIIQISGHKTLASVQVILDHYGDLGDTAVVEDTVERWQAWRDGRGSA
jgi:integrase